MSALGRD